MPFMFWVVEKFWSLKEIIAIWLILFSCLHLQYRREMFVAFRLREKFATQFISFEAGLLHGVWAADIFIFCISLGTGSLGVVKN